MHGVWKWKNPLYRYEINSLQIQLSRTQAGPGRAVKEQHEQNSPNHGQRINLISVLHVGIYLRYAHKPLEAHSLSMLAFKMSFGINQNYLSYVSVQPRCEEKPVVQWRVMTIHA